MVAQQTKEMSVVLNMSTEQCTEPRIADLLQIGGLVRVNKSAEGVSPAILFTSGSQQTGDISIC